jgi:hypothetical protein
MSEERERERRGSKRIALHAKASLRAGQRTLEARFVDISLGGALLQLARELRSARGPCFLSVEFGRDPEEALMLPVTVTDAAGTRVRVRWERALDTVDLFKLRRLKEQELRPVEVVHGPLPMLVWPGQVSPDKGR